MSLKYLLVLLSILMILPSCKNRDKGVLVITDNSNITRNSHSDLETISSSVLGALLFDSLVIGDKNGSWHNQLAEEVNVLSSGKVAFMAFLRLC